MTSRGVQFLSSDMDEHAKVKVRKHDECKIAVATAISNVCVHVCADGTEISCAGCTE